MTPRLYFLNVREAISRLRKPNASLRWKVYYTKQLIESCNVIVKKGYDQVLSDIFKDGISSPSPSKRIKFETLGVILWKDITVIRTTAPYYANIATLQIIENRFESASKPEQNILTERYKHDPVLKDLLRNLQRIVAGASEGIDLRSVTQLASQYYGRKSILFQEEE